MRSWKGKENLIEEASLAEPIPVSEINKGCGDSREQIKQEPKRLSFYTLMSREFKRRVRKLIDVYVGLSYS